MRKPTFDQDQLIGSTDVARKFSTVRKLAKEKPLVVTENGRFDTIIIDYKLYEEMYSRLIELEEQIELSLLSDRLSELEKNPETGVRWQDIRRSDRKSVV